MNKRKFLGTIIGVIFWSICVVFFTYAYYEWKSINTSIVLGIQDLATQCSKGPDVNVTNIGPVFNSKDGVKVKFNLSNDLTTTQNFAIELNITSISDTLLVDDFKWVLVKDEDYDNPIREGDFSNFQVGTNTIADILPLESNISNLYQFIVYIDGNMYNDPNIQNNSLKSYLEIGNCGIIAEANQMINSSTSNFRSDTYRNNITTASFVDYIDTTNVALDTEGNSIQWDMSKYQDNRVISWLEDNGTTDENGKTNYNLYIGSNTLIYATALNSFFESMSNLTSVNFDNLDTSLVTRMGKMFYKCGNLTNLDVGGFDTSNVIDMSNMFGWCHKITKLDVGGWNTSKVTSMYYLFHRCYQLSSLDVSGWDTSKVTSMQSMFFNCALTSLDVSGWDTSKVTDMMELFSYCGKLTSLDVSGWDTSNVTDMSYMFNNCSNLTILDVSSFNTSKVWGMRSMFMNCGNLTTLGEMNFDTSKASDVYMFYRCGKLTTLGEMNFEINKAADMSSMFQGCGNITTTITVRNANITKYASMFGSAATAEGTSITVNYTTETSTLVDEMLKTGTGNLIKPENPVPILMA